MMRNLSLLLTILTVAGCAAGHYAQTPDEWLGYFKQGAFMRGTKVSEVDRPTKQVVADLSEFSMKCLNGVVVRTIVGAGLNRSGSDVRYSAGVRPGSAGTNLFYIATRDLNYNAEGMPREGIFVFVSEITAQGKKTKIASHYLSHFEKYAISVDDWASGKQGKCPKVGS